MLLIKKFRQYPLNHLRSVLGVITLFLMVAVLGGCVSSSKFDEMSKERDVLLKKQNELEGNTRFLRNKVETSEEQAARLKAELADAQAQLLGVSKALDGKNLKLIEASQLLNEKNANLSMASEELARRQEELRKTESMLAASNEQLQATEEYSKKTSKLYDSLVGELSTELEANQIKISELKDGISVNLSQEILFPSGSATLSESGLSVIKKVSGSLKNIPHQIIVAGFTDNVSIKGELAKKFPSNWELAGARAASVVRLLESEEVDSDKLTAVSFGENKPIASNDNWETRALNRRIEIRLKPVD